MSDDFTRQRESCHRERVNVSYEKSHLFFLSVRLLVCLFIFVFAGLFIYLLTYLFIYLII